MSSPHPLFRSSSLDDDLHTIDKQLSPLTVSDITRAVKSPSDCKALESCALDLDTTLEKKIKTVVALEGTADSYNIFPTRRSTPDDSNIDRFFTAGGLSMSTESLESCFQGLGQQLPGSLGSPTAFDDVGMYSSSPFDNDTKPAVAESTRPRSYLSVLKPIPLRSPTSLSVPPSLAEKTEDDALTAPFGLPALLRSASPLFEPMVSVGTKRRDTITSRTPFSYPSPIVAYESSEIDNI
jgi:hypothetical protein